MAKKSDQNHFVVTFRDPREVKDVKIQSVKARKIEDSSLGLSFIAISDFVFGQHAVVLDPNDEALKKRLENVKTLHLSIYSVLSIEEIGVENKGLSFAQDKTKLLAFPNTPADAPRPTM